jgi:hypothetical protein
MEAGRPSTAPTEWTRARRSDHWPALVERLLRQWPVPGFDCGRKRGQAFRGTLPSPAPLRADVEGAAVRDGGPNDDSRALFPFPVAVNLIGVRTWRAMQRVDQLRLERELNQWANRP